MNSLRQLGLIALMSTYGGLLGAASAEEVLVRESGARFLGWQNSLDKFKTCESVILTIRDGDKVEKAGENERCNLTKGPGPILPNGPVLLKVEVRALDLEQRTMEIRKGENTETVFVSPLQEDNSPLKISNLKEGDVVAVLKLTKGRVEQVARTKSDLKQEFREYSREYKGSSQAPSSPIPPAPPPATAPAKEDIEKAPQDDVPR